MRYSSFDCLEYKKYKQMQWKDQKHVLRATTLSRKRSTGRYVIRRGSVDAVQTPASEATKGTLWLLEKAFANVNDSGYHQLICHWLQSHRLSILLPIHRLFHPHFSDTMNIDGLSRQTLFNAGGLLDKIVYPEKDNTLVMSCNMYKKWDFAKQALLADLIDRYVMKNESKWLFIYMECLDIHFKTNYLFVVATIHSNVGIKIFPF